MAEGILREILAQPDRTPPHLLVSLSWGLACTVQRDPPFKAGFAGSCYHDPCIRDTFKRVRREELRGWVSTAPYPTQ